MSFYSVIWIIFHVPLRLIYRIKISGVKNIPDGGVILAANHTSMSDVLVISASFSRRLRYMAKKELFKNPVLGKFISALGAYPVNRGGTDIKSIKETLALLQSGEIIGIFPQGTRNPGLDPRTTKVHGGIGLFAKHTGADVLPVFIKTAGNKTRAFHRTEVIFGKVIPNAELGFADGGRDEYMRAATLIFERVCLLGDGDSHEN